MISGSLFIANDQKRTETTIKELETLRSELMSAVEKAGSLDDLEKIRVSALGKKGRITELMKGLGGMDPDSRKQAGQSLNALKAEIADAIESTPVEIVRRLEEVRARNTF